MTIRDDWQLIAAASRAGNDAEVDRLAERLGSDGRSLMNVTDEIKPQNDLARAFGVYGQNASTWGQPDADMSALDIDLITQTSLGEGPEVASLMALLPADRLIDCP
jgi:hypothetical protein